MRHHFREPTVSKVSCGPLVPECRPFSPALPVTLAHSFVELKATEQGSVRDCHHRTMWWPLTCSIGSPALPPSRLTLRFFTTPTRPYHGSTFIRPSSHLRRHSDPTIRCLHASQVRDPRGPDACCRHASGTSFVHLQNSYFLSPTVGVP